ncbi:MAG: hypothetical protein ABSC13_10390, partial [Dehalococcoidia bacterium]
MPRRFSVIIAVVTCLALVVAVMLFIGRPRESHADPLQGTRLELDMDPTNGTGPCNPVDTTVQHQTGDTYVVAVCLTDAPSAPSAIDFTVTYDDTLNQCLPTPCSASDGHCLDSNPDANTGATVFSSPSLGTNWECGLGAAPRCDADPLTGPGHGAAQLGCFSDFPPTLPAGPGVSSPIAEVRLHAFAPGTDNLSLQRVLLSDSYTDPLVDCEGLGDCFGGSDTKTGSPVTPLPVATATPTTQPTPTPAVTTAPHFADVQIDMDPTNGSGPCNPVDASAQHNVGDVYSVAVCLTNSQSPPGVFQYNLVYDDSANQCVPTACAPDDSLCLDSNPDANAGSTVFSTPSLGTGWTCEAGNAWPPNCDEDPATGPGHGVAYIGCLSLDSSTQTLPVGPGVSAPLAEVKFRALTPGTQSLSLLGVDAGDSVGNTLVACGDGSTCSGGTNTNVPYPMFADVIPAGTGDTANLWLMKSCVDPTKGEGCLEIDEWIYGIFDTCNPNDIGCTVPEGLGAWEHELFWDKQFVSVSTTPDNAWLTSLGRVIPPNG